MGKYMGELQNYHTAYKKAFLEGDAMGAVVRLLARCLETPDGARSDEQVRLAKLKLRLRGAPSAVREQRANLG